jgi:hypothetical protein
VAGIRVVEVLAAVSLTTDIASGVAFEKGLRTCAVATAFGRELGLPHDELSALFYAALVRRSWRPSRARSAWQARTECGAGAGPWPVWSI